MVSTAYAVWQRVSRKLVDSLTPDSSSSLPSPMAALDSLPDLLEDAWMYGNNSHMVSRPSSPVSGPSVPSPPSSLPEGTLSPQSQRSAAASVKPWSSTAAGVQRSVGVWAGDNKPRVRRGGPSLFYVPAKAGRTCPCSANGWEDEWVTCGLSSSADNPQPPLLRAGSIILHTEPDATAHAAPMDLTPAALAPKHATPTAPPGAAATAAATATATAADPLLGLKAPALKRLRVPLRDQGKAWLAREDTAGKVKIIMCQTYDDPPALMSSFGTTMPLKCPVH